MRWTPSRIWFGPTLPCGTKRQPLRIHILRHQRMRVAICTFDLWSRVIIGAEMDTVVGFFSVSCSSVATNRYRRSLTISMCCCSSSYYVICATWIRRLRGGGDFEIPPPGPRLSLRMWRPLSLRLQGFWRQRSHHGVSQDHRRGGLVVRPIAAILSPTRTIQRSHGQPTLSRIYPRRDGASVCPDRLVRPTTLIHHLSISVQATTLGQGLVGGR